MSSNSIGAVKPTEQMKKVSLKRGMGEVCGGSQDSPEASSLVRAEATALAGAVGEALTNAGKHGRADRVTVEERTHFSGPETAKVDRRVVADRVWAARDVHARDLADRIGSLQITLRLKLIRIEVVLNRGRRGERASIRRRARRADFA